MWDPGVFTQSTGWETLFFCSFLASNKDGWEKAAAVMWWAWYADTALALLHLEWEWETNSLGQGYLSFSTIFLLWLCSWIWSCIKSFLQCSVWIILPTISAVANSYLWLFLSFKYWHNIPHSHWFVVKSPIRHSPVRSKVASPVLIVNRQDGDSTTLLYSVGSGERPAKGEES